MPRRPTYDVAEIGPQLQAARAAGRPWGELEEVFGLTRQALARYLRDFRRTVRRKPAPRADFISLHLSR